MGKRALGELLRTRRKALGVSQRHLAEYAGIAVNTLYQIERGQANPTFEVLAGVLDVLGLALDVRVKVPQA